jgi:hypothetical protein
MRLKMQRALQPQMIVFWHASPAGQSSGFQQVSPKIGVGTHVADGFGGHVSDEFWLRHSWPSAQSRWLSQQSQRRVLIWHVPGWFGSWQPSGFLQTTSDAQRTSGWHSSEFQQPRSLGGTQTPVVGRKPDGQKLVSGMAQRVPAGQPESASHSSSGVKHSPIALAPHSASSHAHTVAPRHSRPAPQWPST